MKRILFGLGRGLIYAGRALGVAGRATVALIGICGVVAALANYTMTQGSGTTFGSIVVGGVHYAQQLVCDYATPATCAAVKAGNAAGTTDPSIVVADPNVLAAINAPIPSQSPAVPIGGIGICDGANGTTNPCTTAATVKAASTAPVATDKALVATLSPNTGEVGTPATGISQASGGVGLSGWLSVIKNILSDVWNSTNHSLQTTSIAATPATPIAVAASDNHATLKNGAGVAMSVHTSNNSATKNYLRLYDAGTGFNGCNSATGVIFAMEIPPNDGGFSVSLGGGTGISFSNGLSWCITSGFGLTDTTNATASAIYANASYR